MIQLVEWVETLAVTKNQVHIVKGDFDELPNFPIRKVLQVGNVKIGVIHGHEIVPWGDVEALAAVQRELDCDILVSGHTHQSSIT